MKKTLFEENQSIRDLLDSIIPETKIDSLFSSHSTCLFFLDIESYSLINKYFDFILWIIFFLIMDFIIFMQSFPNNFLSTLNNFVESEYRSSPEFIEIRLSIQQASILINITIFFFVIYQWYKFFTFKPSKHLNHRTATFLYFTTMYFPIIMTPILGSFFGANIITNEVFQSRDGTLLSLYVMVSTILLLINHLVYSFFVYNSLSLKNSFFAYWNPPFNTIDLIYFFAVSVLFTFRSGSLDKFTTISGVIGIIYGILSIYYLRYTIFIFSTGKFCLLKIYLDSILFGIFTIINIWIDISFLRSAITAFLLFFTTGIISYLVIGPGNEKIHSEISINNFLSFSSYKIRNAEEALFILRNAATFSIPGISDPNFIQYLVKNRFSSKLVADVVRLSIYSSFDLGSIIIPRIILSPFEILPLKYMTFQYKIFKNMIKSDKIKKELTKEDNEKDKLDTTENNNNSDLDNNQDPIISDVCHKLQQEKARAEEILDTFWTENDSKQLNIYQLGNAIHEISYQFSMYGSIFKQCETIQEIWKSFAIDVLSMPSAQKMEPNILNMFVYKTKGLLTYLIDCSSISTTQKQSSSPQLIQSQNPSSNDNINSSNNNNIHNSESVDQNIEKNENSNTNSNPKLIHEPTSSVSMLFNSGSPDASIADFLEIEHQPKLTHNRSHFLNEWPNNSKKRPEKSELVKYFKDFQNKNIRPILILFIVTTVLICTSGILFGISSNEQTHSAIEKIVDVFDLMLMGLTVSSQLASTFDNYTIYPNTSFISTCLGISEDEARLFRSKRILPCEFDIDVYEKLENLPIQNSNFDELYNCSFFSFSLYANYKLPEDSSIHSRGCYFYGILFFIEKIKYVTQSKLSTSTYDYDLKLTDYLVLIIFITIFIIIFITFYFIFDRRMHHYFLKAVAHISCSGSNKNFTERTDFSFNFFVQFSSFLALLSCTVLMYCGHSLPIKSLQKKSENFQSITYALGLISIRIQETMASILYKMMLNSTDYMISNNPSLMINTHPPYNLPSSVYFSNYANFYNPNNLSDFIMNVTITTVDPTDLIALFCREIIYYVNFLTFEKGFPLSFNSVPLLNTWFNKNGVPYSLIIGDWATFGIENITKFNFDSFKCFYMRYVYQQTLSSFIQDSYIQAINLCFVEMTKNTFSDWYIIILTIILSFILLSAYFYIHKRKKIWFYGASLLLRRRITKDQRFIVSLRQILENGNIPEFLDLLPFAAVVKDRNNIIIDSNWRVQKFTKLTTRQLVGQNFNDIFYKKRMLKINPKDIEITELKNTKNDQDLIVLRENFGLENIKESLNQIIKRFNFNFNYNIGYNSKNNLSIIKNAVFIEVKLENGSFKPEESFNLFNSIEESYYENSDKIEDGWVIKRIACGAMFYTALCYFVDNGKNDDDNIIDIDSKKKKIFQFLADFSYKTSQSNAIIVATMGKISCYSLENDNKPDINIGVIAAGKPVSRAHDLCLYGKMGRLYIDFNLIEFSKLEKEDINFLFIAKQGKKKKRVTFLLNDVNNNNDNDNELIKNDENNNNNNDNDDEDDNHPVFYNLPEWVLPIMPI